MSRKQYVVLLEEAPSTYCSSPRARCYGSRNSRRHFDRAAKQIGVPGLVPHELRHAATSLAISAGGTVKSVQRMLGHASATLQPLTATATCSLTSSTTLRGMDEAARQAGVYRTCTEADLTLFAADGMKAENAV